MKKELLDPSYFRGDLSEIMNIKLHKFPERDVEDFLHSDLNSELSEKFWIPLHDQIERDFNRPIEIRLSSCLQKLERKTKKL